MQNCAGVGNRKYESPALCLMMCKGGRWMQKWFTAISSVVALSQQFTLSAICFPGAAVFSSGAATSLTLPSVFALSTSEAPSASASFGRLGDTWQRPRRLIVHLFSTCLIKAIKSPDFWMPLKDYLKWLSRAVVCSQWFIYFCANVLNQKNSARSHKSVFVLQQSSGLMGETYNTHKCSNHSQWPPPPHRGLSHFKNQERGKRCCVGSLIL